MKIAQFNIGEAHPCFIIAEIGMNHNGSMDNAKKLIDQAKECGVDCVKFQMRHLDQVYSKAALDQTSSDLSTQYTMDLLKRFELSTENHQELKKYAESLGLVYMCTPWDKLSVDTLEKIGVPGYKMASADFTNFELIEYLVSKKKPIILSTGMSREEEIEKTVHYLKELKADFALLHTNSTYPAPFKDIHLRYMKKLAHYGVPVGYSGHERGTAVTIAAVALGAQIVERHFTLDRNMEGPDHAASLEQKDFKSMVEGIRQTELAFGTSEKRSVSQGELINRENLAKSIFAIQDIPKGTSFKRSMFESRSPGKGLSPQYLHEIEDKEALRDVKKGDCLYLSDIEKSVTAKDAYDFNHIWGIPVRYHDVASLLEQTNPDFLEFHLSYRDLQEDPEKFLKGTYSCGFMMHVPELFQNDHLLDLCTSDTAYREISIAHLKKVIDITIRLKEFFPSEKRPKVIIHCGGFTRDAHLLKEERAVYYERLADALTELSNPEIELLPENMAPFPWHFGGQRYQNIFVDADEIVAFCQKTLLRICQDVSHSKLACTYYGWDHNEYTKKLAPYTAHYHISDGEGVDGEGLQIGDGLIDFENVGKILKQYSPEASFITEVWQGHKNNGEGFWKSLERLEGYL